MVVSSAYQAAALMSVISFAGALVFVGCGRLASKFGIDDDKALKRRVFVIVEDIF